MQKWEYLLINRKRGWQDKRYEDAKILGIGIQGYLYANNWENYIEDKRMADNIEELIQTLGDSGWELVSISARSNHLGGESATMDNSFDFAGFTSNEVWVFKRPKE